MIANGFPSTNLKQPQSLQILGAHPVLCHHELWQSHLQKVFISHQDSELFEGNLNVCHTILYHTKINTTYYNLIKLVSVKWKIWKSNICATKQPKSRSNHGKMVRAFCVCECSCRSYCSSTLDIPPFRQLWMPTGYSRPMPIPALGWPTTSKSSWRVTGIYGVWQGYIFRYNITDRNETTRNKSSSTPVLSLACVKVCG